MAYDFLGLVNDVNRRLNEVELTSSNFSSATGFYSQIKDSVNSSIRYINQSEFKWPFNHNTQEDTLTPGTVRYAFQANAKSIDMDSFRIKRDDTLGNETEKLKIISYEEYLEKYSDYEYNTSNTGIRTVPSSVFRAPNQYYGVLSPPDKAYTLVYEYYALPTDLSVHGDSPSIPVQFRHIIVDGAMYYAYLFRGNTQDATLMQSKLDDGIKNMRSIYINRYDYLRSTVIERSNSLTSTFSRVS
jgi:hypothetical protein